MKKHFNKNKLILVILFAILSFFVVNKEVNALANISVGAGDYELVCTYDNGAELTITRDEIYLTNVSSGLNSAATGNISFYKLKEEEDVKDANGNIVTYGVDKIVTDGSEWANGTMPVGHCPQELHVYKVEASDDKNTDTEDEDELEDTFNYYYATRSGVEKEVTGEGSFWTGYQPKGTEEKDKKTKIISEEIILTTSKQAVVCDYKTKSDDSLGVSSISIYLFNNITIVESENRTTPLWDVQRSCPIQTGTLYLNDPNPRSVGGAYSGNYQFNYARYSYSSSSSTCKARNNNRDCMQYEFVGSRNDTPDNGNDLDPCKLLGNDTVMVLKEVIGWLQILVPAIVIVLIGLDITKMVLAGNLDEELPKKKKSIIIRLIIMLLFFFAPVIATLIINLLVEAGVNIGDFKCLIS